MTTKVHVEHHTPKGHKLAYQMSTNHGQKPEEVLLAAVHEIGILLAEMGQGEQAKQRLDLALKLHEYYKHRKQLPI